MPPLPPPRRRILWHGKSHPDFGLFDPFEQFNRHSETDGSTPADTFYILTEAGDRITTETGDPLIQE